MILKDLKDIISDDCSVGICIEGINSPPIINTWRYTKTILKDNGWNSKINKIYSSACILIELKSQQDTNKNKELFRDE